MSGLHLKFIPMLVGRLKVKSSLSLYKGDQLTSPKKSSTTRTTTTTTTNQTSRRKSSFQSIIVAVVTIIMVIASVRYSRYQTTIKYGNMVENKNPIYVRGGAFSGFWYMLGQLEVVPDVQHDHHLVCYSAGCFVSVMALQNMTAQDAIDFGKPLQQAMLEGKISRFDMVERFVDWVVFSRQGQERQEHEGHKELNQDVVTRAGVDQSTIHHHPSWLSNLSLISCVPCSDWWCLGIIPQTVIRTPNSLDELHEFLTQSTWIPGLTGRTWLYSGHMDGGFSFFSRTPFRQHFGFPADNWKYWLHMFNPAFPEEMAKEFAQLGRENRFHLVQ